MLISNQNKSSNQTPDIENKTSETKVIISNLAQSVTQVDLVDLIARIGAFRTVKLISKTGSTNLAEIVFLKREDAENAVRICHNQEFQGMPMKCGIYTPQGTS